MLHLGPICVPEMKLLDFYKLGFTNVWAYNKLIYESFYGKIKKNNSLFFIIVFSIFHKKFSKIDN